jgi:hypothetical protein
MPSIVPAVPEDCAGAEMVNAKKTIPANAGRDFEYMYAPE